MTTVSADIAVSLDGYAAGPNQSADLPFGEGVDGRLTTWMVDHADENRAEIDAVTSAGAYIMGRNMFQARPR
jgi:dihydrofolate reductase